MKKMLIGLFLLLMVSPVYPAQMIASITPIFAKQVTVLNESFIDRGILYEGDAGVFSSGVALRGYHLFKKSFSNSSSVYDAATKKYVPLSVESSFFASRIELGIPFFSFGGSVIEPFFVNSYTNNCYSVSGEKISYGETRINNTPGLGIMYTQLISRGQSINAKYFSTPKDSLLDLKYNWFRNTSAISAGYTFRTYDHIKIEGPFLAISIIF